MRSFLPNRFVSLLCPDRLDLAARLYPGDSAVVSSLSTGFSWPSSSLYRGSMFAAATCGNRVTIWQHVGEGGEPEEEREEGGGGDNDIVIELGGEEEEQLLPEEIYLDRYSCVVAANGEGEERGTYVLLCYRKSQKPTCAKKSFFKGRIIIVDFWDQQQRASSGVFRTNTPHTRKCRCGYNLVRIAIGEISICIKGF